MLCSDVLQHGAYVNSEPLENVLEKRCDFELGIIGFVGDGLSSTMED